MTQSVLITGCSDKSIGAALVRAFSKRGFHVFATARDTSKMSSLSSLQNVTFLKLDVTSQEDIRAVVKEIEASSGGSLQYLVNNAGAAPVMPVLDVNMENAKKLFDANFWGPLALVQAFAPVLAKAQGTIVNVASINGVVAMPYFGIYNASKAALIALSETLRQEVAPLNIRVITVMAGAIDTPGLTRYEGTFALPAASLYRPASDIIKSRAEGAEKVPRMNVDVFADKLVGDVLGGARGLVWRGAMATTARIMTWLLPTSAMDFIRRYGMGFEKL